MIVKNTEIHNMPVESNEHYVTISTKDSTLDSSAFIDALNNTSIYTAAPSLNWYNGSSSDMELSGDLKIKGVSVLETLEKIQDRLAILQPDPAKLEKYDALRKAYEHYKLLEKLLHEQ